MESGPHAVNAPFGTYQVFARQYINLAMTDTEFNVH